MLIDWTWVSFASDLLNVLNRVPLVCHVERTIELQSQFVITKKINRLQLFLTRPGLMLFSCLYIVCGRRLEAIEPAIPGEYAMNLVRLCVCSKARFNTKRVCKVNFTSRTLITSVSFFYID